jgi:hypothetical protein
MKKTKDIDGWREEFRRGGAPPPLIFFPPLEQHIIQVKILILFERGSP